MAVVPDTKDWTWVLERRCPECGFDATAVAYPEIPGILRENAGKWAAVLGRDGVAMRDDERTWSDLEYAAHVRDVCRVFQARLELMLDSDGDEFAAWDQDAAAVDARYREQDPAVVATELSIAAEAAASAFAVVPPEQRQRTGRRGDGASFTVETLALYFAHEHVHHLHDVTR